MAQEIPSIIPQRFRAGETVKWNRSLSDYPASEYALKYVLINATKKITFSASAAGDTHSVALTSATTDDYTAGMYTFFEYAEKGAGASLERYQVSTGAIEILPDLTAQTTTTYDGRSHAKKMVDLLQTAIQGLASRKLKSYSIEGIAYVEKDLPEMRKELAYWQSEYNAELNAAKISRGEKPATSLRVQL